MAARDDLKKIHQIIGHPKWPDALGDIDENGAAAQQAKGDPKGYFQGKGIPIPPEAKIGVVQGSWTITISIGIISISYSW